MERKAHWPWRPTTRTRSGIRPGFRWCNCIIKGGEKRSISRFMHVSRPTVDAWIQRFETEHLAGLLDKSRAPKTQVHKVWLPLMIQVYHLQKRHPDAGEFRLWSLLAQPTISVRTVGRIMAVNKLVYDDIPHVKRPSTKLPPQPHPYKAQRCHQYWFIDWRQMCDLQR